MGLLIDVPDAVLSLFFAGSLPALVSETLFRWEMPLMGSRAVLAAHGGQKGRHSSLEIYFVRVLMTFFAATFVLLWAGILGFVSCDQRRHLWMFLVIHHIFDGLFLHTAQVVQPEPAVAFLGDKKHRVSMVMHAVVAGIYGLFIFAS